MGTVKNAVRILKSSRVFHGAAIALLLVEVVVRIPGFWTLDINSSTGSMATAVQMALQEAPHPQVIVMGNSRMMDAISPLVLADSLSLPSSAVANLSFAGGTASDFLHVYRKHRSELSNAKVLIIGIDPEPVSHGFGDHDLTWRKFRFRQYASFSQRVAEPGWLTKVDLTAGWFWRTWDARFMINGYTGRLLNENKVFWKRPKMPASVDDEDVHGGRFDSLKRIRIIERTKGYISDKRVSEISQELFLHYQLSDARLKDIKQLIDIAEADGLNVILLDSLLNPAVDREIERNSLAERALWTEKVEEATGLRIQRVVLEDYRCGEWRNCFIDLEHLNLLGARIYSEILGEWLLAAHPAVFLADAHDCINGEGCPPTSYWRQSD